MVSFIDLQSALDALHHAKKDGQGKDQDGNPEGIPLDTIAPVTPPLGKRVRARLVEDLLENY